MITLKQFFTVVLVAFSIINFQAAVAQKNAIDYDKTYAPSFTKVKGPILVYQFRPSKSLTHTEKNDEKKINKKIAESFAQFYKGNYILVEQDKDSVWQNNRYLITDSTYADVNQYRYIFTYFFSDNISYGSSGNSISTSMSCGMYDRLENKRYVAWTGYNKIEEYVQKLEEVRAK